jgi:plasmid maintenance system killer protein
MILGYRDKRTRDFANGKRVQAFSSFDRSARLKLDRLEAAHFGERSDGVAGESFRVAEARKKRAVQHTNQRSVANLF